MRIPAKMNFDELRIVFMGTPEFAVASLQRLRERGCNIAGVVTAPDKPAGRGKKTRQSAVKQYSLEQGLNVLQPENLKSADFLHNLEALAPHIQVVVAFRMLPEPVWKIPPLGTFNLHASLLPDYRGAAPINHVLMNGETRTGVTTFMIDQHIDTGLILLQEETPIGPEETAGELHDRLMQSGAELVVETVRRLAAGTIQPKPQPELLSGSGTLHAAPKITREDCRIDWTGDGQSITNKIRGLSPYPGAVTYLLKEDPGPLAIKIFRAVFEPGSHGYENGTLLTDGRKVLKVAADHGYVRILSLQQEGKRRMDAGEFLSGFRLISGQYRFS